MSNVTDQNTKTYGDMDALVETIVEIEEAESSTRFPEKFRQKFVSIIKNRRAYVGGGALVLASFTGSVLNYIFNAYLGRILNFDDFALIGLIGGFFAFASVLFGAYTTTVNYRSAFLIGKYDEAAGYGFWKHTRKNVVYFSIAIAIVWLLVTPILMKFFDTNNPFLFLFFSIVLLVGFVNSLDRGFLSAKLMFGSLAVVNFLDPAIKLLATLALVYLGWKTWTYSTIPISVFAIFIIVWLLVIKQTRKENSKAPNSEMYHFPKKFFSISLLTGFSTTAFFTLDILLANHFLSPTQAGEYTLVSLVGKMIFFLGNLTSPFLIPLISRDEGANKNSLRTLFLLVASTLLLALTGFVAFGIFGYFTAPFFYGNKAIAIVPYLFAFTFGMTCYTVSRVLVNYYLVKELYTVTIATSSLVLFQILFIFLYHDSAQAIAIVMSVIFIAHLMVTTMLHIANKYVRIFEDKITNLL